jgi:hypothetical protein
MYYNQIVAVEIAFIVYLLCTYCYIASSVRNLQLDAYNYFKSLGSQNNDYRYTATFIIRI